MLLSAAYQWQGLTNSVTTFFFDSFNILLQNNSNRYALNLHQILRGGGRIPSYTLNAKSGQKTVVKNDITTA